MQIPLILLISKVHYCGKVGSICYFYYRYFDRFEMCSSALHVRNCYPKGDGISDQEHMLANPILRTW